jgi:hypothetical protein
MWHHGQMRKRSSKRDVAQNARRVVEEAIGAPLTQKPSKSVISQVMSVMGRKGGKVGGKARAAKLSPERKREIASHAARIRWKAEKEEADN